VPQDFNLHVDPDKGPVDVHPVSKLAGHSR